MEKLLELLNEFEQLNMCRKFDCFDGHTFENSSGVDRLLEDTVISRRYGFIEWLVENDKINFRKLDYNKFSGDKFMGEVPARYYLGTYIRYSYEKEILMTLAIQDEPIEFLVSILK